jgi:hypothetical protein
MSTLPKCVPIFGYERMYDEVLYERESEMDWNSYKPTLAQVDAANENVLGRTGQDVWTMLKTANTARWCDTGEEGKKFRRWARGLVKYLYPFDNDASRTALPRAKKMFCLHTNQTRFIHWSVGFHERAEYYRYVQGLGFSISAGMQDSNQYVVIDPGGPSWKQDRWWTGTGGNARNCMLYLWKEYLPNWRTKWVGPCFQPDSLSLRKDADQEWFGEDQFNDSIESAIALFLG